VSQLEVGGLGKSFGPTQVLTHLDLTVPRGRLMAVLGPSGCGKTTLLRIVAGFETADAGTVTIGDTLVAGPRRHLPPERRRVAIVPQEGALFPHLDVSDNIGFGLAHDRRRPARVARMLEMLELVSLQHRMPHELSGGQQQRVALARALAPEPALVLLDEPFNALDTGLRAAVREDVRAALHQVGATAVLVTHDQQEALSMADAVAVMRDGRIVQAGPPADVYRTPADLGVATFVGETVILDGELGEGVVRCALGRLPVRPNGRASGHGHVVLRPEQLVLGPPETGLHARVLHVEFFGHDALVSLALDGITDLVRAHTRGPDAPQSGDRVGVTVSGEALFFS
jgi:iron(III) transport system ATP-binding protein